MKEELIKYLREKVINRVLLTDEVVYSLEEGNLQGVYSDKMIFSDLMISDNGGQFNMTTVANEQIYKVDEREWRGEVIKDFTGTSVFHYELAMRKSTSQITGFMRGVSSTVPDHTMEAIIYGIHNVRFEDGQLKWDEQQLFYRDNPSGEGKFRPVAFDSRVRFYQEKDKTVFEYLPTYYDVDPVTMLKTESKDKCPPYLTKEE